MPRPQFSLKTMLWLVIVVAVFFAGREYQRRYDEHWFAGAGTMAPDKYDFQIWVEQLQQDPTRYRTTIQWGDGVIRKTDGGLENGGGYYYIRGRARNAEEQRAFENEHYLTPGLLDRR